MGGLKGAWPFKGGVALKGRGLGAWLKWWLKRGRGLKGCGLWRAWFKGVTLKGMWLKGGMA